MTVNSNLLVILSHYRRPPTPSHPHLKLRSVVRMFLRSLLIISAWHARAARAATARGFDTLLAWRYDFDKTASRACPSVRYYRARPFTVLMTVLIASYNCFGIQLQTYHSSSYRSSKGLQMFPNCLQIS